MKVKKKKIPGIKDHDRDWKIPSLEEQKTHKIIPETNFYFAHCSSTLQNLYLNLEKFSS